MVKTFHRGNSGNLAMPSLNKWQSSTIMKTSRDHQLIFVLTWHPFNCCSQGFFCSQVGRDRRREICLLGAVSLMITICCNLSYLRLLYLLLSKQHGVYWDIINLQSVLCPASCVASQNIKILKLKANFMLNEISLFLYDLKRILWSASWALFVAKYISYSLGKGLNLEKKLMRCQVTDLTKSLPVMSL